MSGEIWNETRSGYTNRRESKKVIRDNILKLRESLSREKAEKCGKTVSGKLIKIIYPVFKNVMVFSPFRNEIDITTLTSFLLSKKDVIVSMPKTVNGFQMKAVMVEKMNNLVKGRYGIREPSGNTEISPEDIDVIIVPAVAFDRKFNRIGFGAGYYDRFLKRTNALKIGVGYDFQIVSEIPTEEHDQKLDAIITPSSTLFRKI